MQLHKPFKKDKTSAFSKDELMKLDSEVLHNKAYDNLALSKFIIRDADLRNKMQKSIPYLAGAFEAVAVEVLTNPEIYSLIKEEWQLSIIAENNPQMVEKFQNNVELQKKMDVRFIKLLDRNEKSGSLELC